MAHRLCRLCRRCRHKTSAGRARARSAARTAAAVPILSRCAARGVRASRRPNQRGGSRCSRRHKQTSAGFGGRRSLCSLQSAMLPLQGLVRTMCTLQRCARNRRPASGPKLAQTRFASPDVVAQVPDEERASRGRVARAALWRAPPVPSSAVAPSSIAVSPVGGAIPVAHGSSRMRLEERRPLSQGAPPPPALAAPPARPPCHSTEGLPLESRGSPQSIKLDAHE